MPTLETGLHTGKVDVLRLESEWLCVDVAPEVGGRVVSLIAKDIGHEFLWRNSALPLQRMPSGSEYDSNFYGGIDELIPNDIPESLSGVNCPDHGELWTTPLTWSRSGGQLLMRGQLPRFGLTYERTMTLRPDAPCLECSYRLTNPTEQPRQFLWKLHAALNVKPGDRIECPAQRAQVVDLAWSRFKSLEPFAWPNLEGRRADLIPAPEGTVDFFYLFDLATGQIALHHPDTDVVFAYEFDLRVFPFAWLFASYGGFNGHYTVILEPCSAMPLSVQEAAQRRQCSELTPGASLSTTVRIWAGQRGKIPFRVINL
jgi:hypothetical protein